MADTSLGEPLSWDHIYLLGWYDGDGRAFLTSWSVEGLPPFAGIVTRGGPHGPPLWSAPVGNAKVYVLPKELTGANHLEKCRFAKSVGGVYVIGWQMKDPINRTPKAVGC